MSIFGQPLSRRKDIPLREVLGVVDLLEAQAKRKRRFVLDTAPPSKQRTQYLSGITVERRHWRMVRSRLESLGYVRIPA